MQEKNATKKCLDNTQIRKRFVGNRFVPLARIFAVSDQVHVWFNV